MLILLTTAALAGTPALTLDTVFDSEGKPGEIGLEEANARVAKASARLDALLETDQWYASSAIPGADAFERYGAFRGRLPAWAHADEWSYTPSKHAIQGGIAESDLSEAVWNTRYVQSNVKLARTDGAVTEVAFFSREIVGERMPSERTVAIWLRFDGGEPVEAVMRSTDVNLNHLTNTTHWTFTPDGAGGLTNVTETEVISYLSRGIKVKTSDSTDEATIESQRHALRTWGITNT